MNFMHTGLGNAAAIVRWDNEKRIPVAYSIFAKYGTTDIDYFVEQRIIVSS